jgi:hypothetical protein
MANTFRNVRQLIGTGALGVPSIYIAPAGTTAIVMGCQLANVAASAEEVTLYWRDDSVLANTDLVHDVVIPVGATLAPIAGKLVLETGDIIFATTTTTSGVEITVSVLEIT